MSDETRNITGADVLAANARIRCAVNGVECRECYAARGKPCGRTGVTAHFMRLADDEVAPRFKERLAAAIDAEIAALTPAMRAWLDLP